MSQVAKDLDIGASVVGRWVRESQADKKHAFPGRGQMKPDDAEVARLKRELIRVALGEAVVLGIYGAGQARSAIKKAVHSCAPFKASLRERQRNRLN